MCLLSPLSRATILCRELKQRITPEMIELIKQQRLNYLVNGTRFGIKLGRRSGLLITAFSFCLIACFWNQNA